MESLSQQQRDRLRMGGRRKRRSYLPSLASPFWSSFLYRGQVKRHPRCIPSVFRGLQFVDHPQKLTRRERAQCFLERVRLEEFLLALADHPAVAYAREIGLKMNCEALAQHYEMATDRLDLSQDPEVAAFCDEHADR